MRCIAAAVLMLTISSNLVAADPYPSRRITVIAPFGAGSGTDSITRIVSQRLAETLKTTVVVENHPGANGAIGALAAARSASDGYTLLFGGSSTHSANPNMLASIQYDPKEDFVPVSRLGVFPYVLVVGSEVPAQSVKELVEFGRRAPGSLSFAHGNALGQLAGEMFKRRAGIDVRAIPYKSSPEGITDVVAGRVSMMFVDLAPVVSLIRSGQLRALATITRNQSSLIPTLPSLEEQGLDFSNLSAWTGLFAPKGTPKDVTERLSETLRAIMADPAVRQRVAEIGFEANWMPSGEFASYIAQDIDLWARLTREAGIERR